MLFDTGKGFVSKMKDESTTTKDLFCKMLRCKRYLGRIVDGGVSFEVGNLHLFDSFRASCLCGKSFTFRSRSFSTIGFKGDEEAGTRKILNGLGRSFASRPPRIADNFDDDFEG